jgi:hypothetical protein
MSTKQISAKEAFQLVGAQAFPDWCPIERYRELDRERAAKSSLPRFLTGSTPVFAPPPSAYDKAKEQLDAVALWLSTHGFLPELDSYDVADLQQAITDDPLRPSAPDKSQRGRPSNGEITAYVRKFVRECESAGGTPSQEALRIRARNDGFRAQRKRLFDELTAQGIRLPRSRPHKSPK